jgi:hypothetical protein
MSLDLAQLYAYNNIEPPFCTAVHHHNFEIADMFTPFFLCPVYLPWRRIFCPARPISHLPARLFYYSFLLLNPSPSMATLTAREGEFLSDFAKKNECGEMGDSLCLCPI